MGNLQAQHCIVYHILIGIGACTTLALAVYLDRDVIELAKQCDQVLHPCVVVLSDCQLQDGILDIITHHIPTLQVQPRVKSASIVTKTSLQAAFIRLSARRTWKKCI